MSQHAIAPRCPRGRERVSSPPSGGVSMSDVAGDPATAEPSATSTGAWAAMAAAAFTLFVLILLPLDVMGERVWNEADVLPLARQAVDPSWVPHDWYLNQPPGYRAAFQ